MPPKNDSGTETTSAHGHETTRKVSARSIHLLQRLHVLGVPMSMETSGGIIASTTAPITTQGVYQREKRVMKFSALAFFSEEFSTSSRIFATAAYQAEVLQTTGILYDDILQMIADRTDASVAQVRAMFEDAGVRTVEIDNDTHEAAGEAPADIRQDGGMKQVLEAGYRKTLGTMRNLVSTTANTTQTAFLQACDRAYMQVSSGAFSYQDAIRMAVRDLADGGAYITYPTGHRDRIDVAVRRCVLTGVGQTAAAVAKKRAEDSGCQYMELTAHGGARPEHARWQGQLVQILLAAATWPQIRWSTTGTSVEIRSRS